MATKNILLDTSVIVELGFNGLKQFCKKNPDINLFVSNIVLRELDGLKKAEGEKGYKVRDFYRQLSDVNTKKDSSVFQPYKNDDIFRYLSDDVNLYVITRENYKHKDINDTLIIEIAKDYKLKLFTFDSAMQVRAKSDGVGVVSVRIRKQEELKKEKIILRYVLILSTIITSVFLIFSIYVYINTNSTNYIRYSFFPIFISIILFIINTLLHSNSRAYCSNSNSDLHQDSSEHTFFSNPTTDPSYMGCDFSIYNNK